MSRLNLIDMFTWLLIMSGGVIGIFADNKSWLLIVAIPLLFICFILVMICDKMDDIQEKIDAKESK